MGKLLLLDSFLQEFCRAQKMAAMALRRFAPKILRTSTLPLTSSFSTSPSCLISSSLPSLAPIVQKPAPAFKAQAVVDGQFKEVSLADYAGVVQEAFQEAAQVVRREA